MANTELTTKVGHSKEAKRHRVLEDGFVERVTPQAPLSQSEVCRRLRQLVGTHGIERIILFGSFARGTQTPDRYLAE